MRSRDRRFKHETPLYMKERGNSGITTNWVQNMMRTVALKSGLIDDTDSSVNISSSLAKDVKIASWDIKRATILGGVIFGLSNFFNLYRKPLEFVIPQMIYTTIFGIIVGYVYQETQSLAGPIVMHNVADGLETTIKYLLYLSS